MAMHVYRKQFFLFALMWALALHSAGISAEREALDAASIAEVIAGSPLTEAIDAADKRLAAGRKPAECRAQAPMCVQMVAFAAEAPKKRALIFGVTGQDGAYLTEFLLGKNYEVHGVKRRSSSPNTSRVDAFYEEPQEPKKSFFLHYGDIADASSVTALIQKVQPDEIYNLAAQSHVKVSFEIPEYTAEVVALGTLRVLEAIRLLGMEKKVRYYQASSSEMFGLVQETPQTEKTPFYPRSPYGVSKLFGYWITVNYREAYGMFALNGILFNHESPLRGETFVTRKITLGACRQYYGLHGVLYLGNLDAMRDWGYAKDYVEAMWLMLQQETPEDFVVATGETHSVRECVELTYRQLGIEIEWHGEGLGEYGVNRETGEVLVRVDPRYYRPTEVDLLLGDPRRARDFLGWKPKTSFQELVQIMVEADLKVAERESIVRGIETLTSR